jgi:threonine aldolase
MLGGGMRQAGVLAAAAHYALDHHLPRLAEDHDNARLLAEGLSASRGIACDAARVETNIVNFDVPGKDAARFAREAAREGVRLNAIAPERLRAVTHLDVSRANVLTAVERLARVAATLS